jgi:hypothetical protein
MNGRVERPMTREALVRRIRRWLGFFVVALVISGITAFPLETETRWLHEWLSAPGSPFLAHWPALVSWVERVHLALAETYARHPWMAYGTDWLAFAHLVIAMAFWGPFRDPVRNRWVIDFGLLACAAVVPLALVCGEIRGIPLFWRAIDMSFGLAGAVPLLIVRRAIDALEKQEGAVASV